MRKIKVAQIGVNRLSHGKDIFKTMKKFPEVFEIAGYCLVEGENYEESIRMLEGYPELTLDEILNDESIEAVTVETDEIHLTKYAIMAAQHGKHIHMEKPGGVSLPDFEKLIALVKEKNIVFHTGYMYRYNPYISDAIDRAVSGDLGEIISVEVQMNCTHNKENRQWLECMPGGMMFYLGCHLVDIVYRIQGKPNKVIPLNRSSGISGVTSDDFGMAVLEYPHGVSFVKTTAVEVGGFHRRQLVISGSKKTIEIRPLEVMIPEKDYKLYTEKCECSSESWHAEAAKSRMDLHDRYENMMLSFASMVRGEKNNPYTPDYELELFKLILECCGK